MSLPMVRLVFSIAGIYDLAIGIAFLLFGAQIFERAGVPPPNHWAYLHFSALMLIIFGLAFLAVAANPVANRNIIPYGILLKISYVGLVAFYFFTSGCPMLFQPFAVIDAVMLILFVAALRMRPTAA